jgi:5-methylcytosine-specific restriction endonuclease McrA
MPHKSYRNGDFEECLWDFRESEFIEDPERDIDEQLRVPAVDAAMRQESYDDYLGSSYWRRVQGAIYSRSDKCEKCGSQSNLQIHHKAYPKRFTELQNLHMLVLLCDQCHAAFHH